MNPPRRFTVLTLTLTADRHSYSGTLTTDHPIGGIQTVALRDVSVSEGVLSFSTKPERAPVPTQFRAVLTEAGTLEGRVDIVSQTLGMHNRGTWVAMRDE